MGVRIAENNIYKNNKKLPSCLYTIKLESKNMKKDSNKNTIFKAKISSNFMETITLKIQPEKKEAFLQMLDLFDFVETVDEDTNQDDKTGEDKVLYYDPEKLDYTFEDIQAIATHFPEDYKWTYKDIEEYFPEDLKIKVEVINNKLYIMPSPNIEHQEISNEVSFQIGAFIRKHKLGKILYAPMDVRFDDNNTVQPDILFIAVGNYDILGGKIVEGLPDLCVEIWSPSNIKKDREMKEKLYESRSVKEYWQIKPKTQEVRIEILNEEDKYELFSEAKEKGIVQSKVLKGFDLDIESIFP